MTLRHWDDSKYYTILYYLIKKILSNNQILHALLTFLQQMCYFSQLQAAWIPDLIWLAWSLSKHKEKALSTSHRQASVELPSNYFNRYILTCSITFPGAETKDLKWHPVSVLSSSEAGSMRTANHNILDLICILKEEVFFLFSKINFK